MEEPAGSRADAEETYDSAESDNESDWGDDNNEDGSPW